MFCAAAGDAVESAVVIVRAVSVGKAALMGRVVPVVKVLARPNVDIAICVRCFFMALV